MRDVPEYRVYKKTEPAEYVRAFRPFSHDFTEILSTLHYFNIPFKVEAADVRNYPKIIAELLTDKGDSPSLEWLEIGPNTVIFTREGNNFHTTETSFYHEYEKAPPGAHDFDQLTKRVEKLEDLVRQLQEGSK